MLILTKVVSRKKEKAQSIELILFILFKNGTDM